MERLGREASEHKRYYDVLVLNSERKERDGFKLCDLIRQEAGKTGKTVSAELVKWADFESNEHVNIDKAIDKCLVLLLLLTPDVPKDREVFFKFCTSTQSYFSHEGPGHLMIRVVCVPDKHSLSYYEELPKAIQTVASLNLEWNQPERFIKHLLHLLESDTCRERKQWIEKRLGDEERTSSQRSGQEQDVEESLQQLGIRGAEGEQVPNRRGSIHVQCTEESEPRCPAI